MLSLLKNLNYLSIFLKVLPLFLTGIFLTTVASGFFHYLRNDPFIIGDWLINYQGGFIRRGFIGEILIQIANLTSLSPSLLVFVLQAFCYFIYFRLSYLMLKNEEQILGYSLLILSPFIYTFQLNEFLGGFRKEILIIALLSYLVWQAKKTQVNSNKMLFSLVIILPIVILTHEALIFFAPYLFVVYFRSAQLNSKNLLKGIALATPSLMAFLFCYLYKGNSEQVSSILGSLTEYGISFNDGAIHWLSKDSDFGIQGVLYHFKNSNYLIKYLFSIALALLAFYPIRAKIFSLFKNKMAVLFIVASILGSFILFYVAMDWGRWIYIHLVCLFLLSFLNKGNSEHKGLFGMQNVPLIFKKNVGVVLLVVSLFFYSVFWHIPHCCETKVIAHNIETTNVSSIIRPFLKLYIHFTA